MTSVILSHMRILWCVYICMEFCYIMQVCLYILDILCQKYWNSLNNKRNRTILIEIYRSPTTYYMERWRDNRELARTPQNIGATSKDTSRYCPSNAFRELYYNTRPIHFAAYRHTYKTWEEDTDRELPSFYRDFERDFSMFSACVVVAVQRSQKTDRRQIEPLEVAWKEHLV